MKQPMNHKPLCVILPSVLSIALSACGGEAGKVILPSPAAALPSHSTSAEDTLLKSRLDDLNKQIQETKDKLSVAQSTQSTKPTKKTSSTDSTPELDNALSQIGKATTSPQEDEAVKKDLIQLKAKIALLEKEKDKLQELVNQGATDKALLAEIEKLKAQLAPYLKKEEEANQQLAAEQEKERKRKEADAAKRIAEETARLKEEDARIAKPTLKSGDNSVVEALKEIKEYYEPGRAHFGGAILTVDKNSKTAQAVIMREVDYSIDEQFIDKSLQGKINGSGSLPSKHIKGEGMKEALQNFRIGETPINLLEKDGSKYHLQKLNAENFANSGLTTDAGIVGSKWGEKEYHAFGQLRYGVYNDNQGKSHLFIYGNPSPTLPHGSDKVDIHYRGNAIMGKDGNYRELPKAVTAVLNRNKTDLQISIQASPTEKLEVDTTVSKQFKEFPISGGAGKELGQKFFGENAQMSATGALFGSAEIGGFFAVKSGTHKGEHGVFGATFDSTYLKENPEFEADYKNNNPE